MTSGLRFIFGPRITGRDWEDAVKECGWRFVRSGSQLSLYDEGRNPMGHILTAWEAWNAYGKDVIGEAIEHGSAVLKENKDATETCLAHWRVTLGISPETLAGAFNVSEDDVLAAETSSRGVSIYTLERLAFGLGLDERMLSFRIDCGMEPTLSQAFHALRESLDRNPGTLSEPDVVGLTEATSVMRVQARLKDWLRGEASLDRTVLPIEGKESNAYLARQSGYQLATRAREILGLGEHPVSSMRDVAEEQFQIPVVWTSLGPSITGAAVTFQDPANSPVHGVVLNSVGHNENVWVRRVSLAREIGHVLFNSAEGTSTIRFSCEAHDNPFENVPDELSEQRADAFALAFLAPIEAVRRVAPLPVQANHVEQVMRHFGMCEWAARRRILSCYSGEVTGDLVPSVRPNVAPTAAQDAAEALTQAVVPCSTRHSRRGRFADIVSECYSNGLISEDSAAFYLDCKVDEFTRSVDSSL